MRLSGHSRTILAAAALLAAGVLPAPATAVIGGVDGKIAFQRMNASGDYDIWIRAPRLGAPPEPAEREAVLPASVAGADDTDPAWGPDVCPLLTCPGPLDTPAGSLAELEQILVFASDRTNPGGPRDLFTVDANGAVTNLTSHPGDDGSPALCCSLTDRLIIAFDSNRGEGGDRDIWARPLDGSSEPCRVTSDPAEETNPEWLRNGRHMAFERRIGAETQIWVAEVDVSASAECPARNERPLTLGQPSSFEPSWFLWAPDESLEPEQQIVGHRIAFSGPEDAADRNLHYLELAYPALQSPTTPFADLSVITPATPFDEPSEERGPSWSPHGDGLAFASTRAGGDFDIYFLDEAQLAGAEPSAPPQLLVGGLGADADELNPAIQPLTITDNVKPFRICGRACRARRRPRPEPQPTASGSTTTEPRHGRPKRVGRCRIRGTPGDDLLRGTRRAEVICGLGGDDVLRGGPGRDELRGGRGRDELHGGLGNDTMVGGPGADLLAGDTGRDRSLGGPGADDFKLRGGGKDTVSGGSGTDTAVVDKRDQVRGVERRSR